MKKLILIRHSKSLRDSLLNDFNRNLTLDGIEKAKKCAISSNEFVNKNSTILSSGAVRAYETAKIFIEHWNLTLDRIKVSDNLYTFNSVVLEEIVKSSSNDSENLILFGHNSAITDFVNKFGDVFIDNVPTAGFVSITFDCDNWKEIVKGKTVKILFPRDI